MSSCAAAVGLGSVQVSFGCLLRPRQGRHIGRQHLSPKSLSYLPLLLSQCLLSYFPQAKKKASGGEGGGDGGNLDELQEKLTNLQSDKVNEEKLRNYVQLERVSQLFFCFCLEAYHTTEA